MYYSTALPERVNSIISFKTAKWERKRQNEISPPNCTLASVYLLPKRWENCDTLLFWVLPASSKAHTPILWPKRNHSSKNDSDPQKSIADFRIGFIHKMLELAETQSLSSHHHISPRFNDWPFTTFVRIRMKEIYTQSSASLHKNKFEIQKRFSV